MPALESWSVAAVRGRVIPVGREHLREWLARFAGPDEVHFALEGCNEWRYVALRRETLFVREEMRDLRLHPVAAGR